MAGRGLVKRAKFLYKVTEEPVLGEKEWYVSMNERPSDSLVNYSLSFSESLETYRSNLTFALAAWVSIKA